jgi:hypothetical protein
VPTRHGTNWDDLKRSHYNRVLNLGFNIWHFGGVGGNVVVYTIFPLLMGD